MVSNHMWKFAARKMQPSRSFSGVNDIDRNSLIKFKDRNFWLWYNVIASVYIIDIHVQTPRLLVITVCTELFAVEYLLLYRWYYYKL